MKTFAKHINFALLVSAAMIAAGCGGGGSAGGTTGETAVAGAPTKTIKVIGDSLNDVGARTTTRFTIQQGADTKIWLDHVAAGLGVTSPCNRYRPTSSTTITDGGDATCLNYAVGGAEIIPADATKLSTGYSILQQLESLSAHGFASSDLLLVDGGGNDVATLVSLVLDWVGDSSKTTLFSVTGSVVPVKTQETLANIQKLSAAIGAVLASTELTAAQKTAQVDSLKATITNVVVLLAVNYMEELANRLTADINTKALDKGLGRVVLMNIPDVSLTPKFRFTLQGIAKLRGDALATQVKSIVGALVNAYNLQIKSNFNNDIRVHYSDFSGQLSAWTANPAAYGFTNVNSAACPATPTASGPTYSVHTCTPSNAAANWESYIYSDDFHGTPRANLLMGERLLSDLSAIGWK
jgi:outer membrane lipase/esterase